MFRCFSHVRPFAIPWLAACQAPLSMGFSRQEYYRGLSCPPPGDLPNPGIKPASLLSLLLASRFFTTGATWEALNEDGVWCKKINIFWTLILHSYGHLCKFIFYELKKLDDFSILRYRKVIGLVKGKKTFLAIHSEAGLARNKDGTPLKVLGQ